VGQPPPPTTGDERDPHLVGAEIERLVSTRGWDSDVQVGAVVGRWAAIVGDQVADHVEVVSFEGSVLTVRAVSTAWATQMRLLTSTVLARIESEVGVGVVTEIVVRSPGGPSWRKGPLSSGGRGPRDTYG
jgi:predicted nucleic acid-binding Zn ribbon protein